MRRVLALSLFEKIRNRFEQPGGTKRTWQKDIRPGCHACCAILRCIITRDNDDGDVGCSWILTQNTADFIACHVWHIHIKQDQIGMERFGEMKSMLPIMCQLNA